MKLSEIVSVSFYEIVSVLSENISMELSEIVSMKLSETSPRTSTIVQFIFYFWPLRSA